MTEIAAARRSDARRIDARTDAETSAPAAAAPLTADIVRPDALSADLIARWRGFQAASPSLASPFFAPDFAIAVGGARQDARVAVLRRGDAVVGFFPHHRAAGRVAKPIGGQICDYQGVIHAPGAEIAASDLLSACGLDAYDFNHAPIAQSALKPGAFAFAQSPFMNLSDGFEAYEKSRAKVTKHSLKETARRRRKLEREVGPVRFVLNDRSDRAWETLRTLKNAQYAKSGVKSVLDIPWVDKTLQALRARDEGEAFQGLLSTVYAGDALISAHFGLRAGGTWCWWFNTYDAQYHNLAPGLILLVDAAKTAAEIGVDVIDFGRGDQHYKQVYMTGATELCEGSVERTASAAGLMRKAQRAAATTGRKLPLGKHRDLPYRAVRKAIKGAVHLPG